MAATIHEFRGRQLSKRGKVMSIALKQSLIGRSLWDFSVRLVGTELAHICPEHLDEPCQHETADGFLAFYSAGWVFCGACGLWTTMRRVFELTDIDRARWGGRELSVCPFAEEDDPHIIRERILPVDDLAWGREN